MAGVFLPTLVLATRSFFVLYIAVIAHEMFFINEISLIFL